MIRPGYVGLGVLSLALVIASAIELRSGKPFQPTSSSHSPSRAVPLPTGVVAPSPDQRSGWVEAILARPLFATTRRPPVVARTTRQAPPEAKLPRLAGVVIDGVHRSAIFAAESGAKAVIVAEGGELNGFKVVQIESGRVTVTGAGGRQILSPSFDVTAQPPVVAAPLTAAVMTPPSSAGFNGPPGLDKMPPLITNGQGPAGSASSNLPSLSGLTNIPGIAPNTGQLRR